VIVKLVNKTLKKWQRKDAIVTGQNLKIAQRKEQFFYGILPFVIVCTQK
jgi:hypothetical protein